MQEQILTFSPAERRRFTKWFSGQSRYVPRQQQTPSQRAVGPSAFLDLVAQLQARLFLHQLDTLVILVICVSSSAAILDF